MYVSVKESLTTYTQSGSFILLMPGEDVVTFFLLLFILANNCSRPIYISLSNKATYSRQRNDKRD